VDEGTVKTKDYFYTGEVLVKIILGIGIDSTFKEGSLVFLNRPFTDLINGQFPDNLADFLSRPLYEVPELPELHVHFLLVRGNPGIDGNGLVFGCFKKYYFFI
jgi:hypothetical protein